MRRNYCSALTLLLSLSTAGLMAQRNRVAGGVDNYHRIAIQGHVHPLARAEYEQGRVDPSQRMRHVSIMLKPSDSQQADLKQLLAQQQDPSSTNYHHWLTP